MVARIMKQGQLDYQIHTDDHPPAHVHVFHGDEQATFRIEDGEVNLYKNKGLSTRHIREAQETIEDNVDHFISEFERLTTR